jgi:hypothetical protein
MTRLLFTIDGQLREQTRAAEPRVLPRIAEDRDGASARLVAGDAEHRIVPFAPTGWGFALRDHDDVLSGGFQPFRLRRGGRLRVGAVGMSLHGRPWSHEGWVFSTPDGRRVEATVTAASEQSSPVEGEANANGARPARGFAVVLEATEPLEQLLTFAEVLTIGCWLIALWHRTPPLDHVLVSAPDAAGLAEGSHRPAVSRLARRS